MIEQLKQENKVVGAQADPPGLEGPPGQNVVYMAQDADPRILQPLVQEAVLPAGAPGAGEHHEGTGRGLRDRCGCGHRRPWCDRKTFLVLAE